MKCIPMPSFAVFTQLGTVWAAAMSSQVFALQMAPTQGPPELELDDDDKEPDEDELEVDVLLPELEEVPLLVLEDEDEELLVLEDEDEELLVLEDEDDELSVEPDAPELLDVLAPPLGVPVPDMEEPPPAPELVEPVAELPPTEAVLVVPPPWAAVVVGSAELAPDPPVPGELLLPPQPPLQTITVPTTSACPYRPK